MRGLPVEELTALLGLALVGLLLPLLLLFGGRCGLLAQGLLEALLLGILQVLEDDLLLALPQPTALLYLDLALFALERDF